MSGPHHRFNGFGRALCLLDGEDAGGQDGRLAFRLEPKQLKHRESAQVIRHRPPFLCREFCAEVFQQPITIQKPHDGVPPVDECFGVAAARLANRGRDTPQE